MRGIASIAPMPEGDTVYLTARRLHQALAAELLVRTDFRVPAFATTDLSGQRVTEVDAYGKHLLLRTDGGYTVHSHLKMEGAWRVHRRGARWRDPAHEARVVLETGTVTAIGFRLGLLEVIRTQDEQTVVAHLGPDPLRPEWDAVEAVRRLGADPDRAIAEALLDQTAVAGWGNVYKSEMLFLRGVHPQTPVRAVDLPALVALGARLIQANRNTGNQITTGDTRRGRGRWVYGRRAEPCMRCGTPIGRRVQGERVTYWCPSCQPSTGEQDSDRDGTNLSG